MQTRQAISELSDHILNREFILAPRLPRSKWTLPSTTAVAAHQPR